jgi:hypothetical protein
MLAGAQTGHLGTLKAYLQPERPICKSARSNFRPHRDSYTIFLRNASPSESHAANKQGGARPPYEAI